MTFRRILISQIYLFPYLLTWASPRSFGSSVDVTIRTLRLLDEDLELPLDRMELKLDRVLRLLLCDDEFLRIFVMDRGFWRGASLIRNDSEYILSVSFLFLTRQQTNVGSPACYIGIEL